MGGNVAMLFLQSVFISQREGEGSKEGMCVRLEDAKTDLTYLQTQKLQPSCVTSKAFQNIIINQVDHVLNLCKNASFIFSEEQHTCVCFV